MGRIADQRLIAQPLIVLRVASWHQISRYRPLGVTVADAEAELHLVHVNTGLAIGSGLIAVGLTVLLAGLLWSAARRLRSLPDDPGSLRGLIVAGLVLAAIGVVLAALTVNTP